VQQALLVVAGGDVDVGELEGFRDGEVDLQRGQQRLGGLVVELETFHQFHIAHARGFGGELPQRLSGRRCCRGERHGDRLDLVADDDQPSIFTSEIIEADLGEVAEGVFADDAQQGGAFGVGALHRLAGAVGAQPVAGVAGDPAVLKSSARVLPGPTCTTSVVSLRIAGRCCRRRRVFR
jgi:hypothetical protein